MSVENVEPDQPANQSFRQSDGTSQAGRVHAALDPNYVAVDERSLKDLLAFAQTYCKELTYFHDDNRPGESWSQFLDLNLDQVVAFIEDPESVTPEEVAQLARPHRVLFFTFLKLLRHAQDQLNTLTRRHLDFYYREALRLTAKPAVPDQVHVLLELADGQTEFLLPKGTLLLAGQDSQERDLVYRTDQDLVANQAQVASLKSLFVHREVSGIRDVHRDYRLLKNFPIYGSLQLLPEKEASFIAMLAMALGDPRPGGLLPPYSDKPVTPVTPELLKQIDDLLALIKDNFRLTLPAFRFLMELKQKQAGETRKDDWKKVNDILEKSGKKRAKESEAFLLDRSSPADFEKNLKAALGLKDENFTTFFATLPAVNDIYGLYRLKDSTERTDFIAQEIHLSVGDFTDMMKIVEDVQQDWRQIYDILRAAARKKDLAKTFDPPELRVYDSDKFNLLVKQTLTLGTSPLFPEFQGKTLQSLDDCYDEVKKLEAYFHMSAEDLSLIRKIRAKAPDAKPWEWEQVYDILQKAHVAKALPQRWEALKDRHIKFDFDSMLKFALGHPEPGDNLPEEKVFKELTTDSDGPYIREHLYLEEANFTFIKDTAYPTEVKVASNDDWATVYKIMELAQRRKRQWQATQAQIEQWNNIYVAADATQVQARLGLKEDAATPRWRTFGEALNSEKEVATKPGIIGLAIASPILALAEGVRTITLKLGFKKESFDQDAIAKTKNLFDAFSFFLSTEQKMLKVDTATVTVTKTLDEPGLTITITLTLNEQVPPIAPLADQKDRIQTRWPILHIVPDVKKYPVFQPLLLERVTVEVDVKRITQLTLQNDDGVLDAKTPFEPFGFSPVVGSSFYFAHPELCSKKLKTLSIDIDWMGVPDDLKKHYKAYDSLKTLLVDNKSFKAALSLYDNRKFFAVNKGIQLFKADINSSELDILTYQHELQLFKAKAKAYINIPELDMHELQLATSDEVLNWSRYWKVELLAPDFQHTVYPREAAKNAQTIAVAAAEQVKDSKNSASPDVINPPYTPKIKRLSVDYSASVMINMAELATSGSTAGTTLYHLEPFGYRAVTIEQDEDKKSYHFSPPHFLPQYEHEGELFIGIKGLRPPQNLTLLVQIAEGSADPGAPFAAVHWEYLTGNKWQSLEDGHLLSDQTHGWHDSGIVTFDLPAVEPSMRMPADLYWIRANIAKSSRSVGDTIAIHAQAVQAAFLDQGNAPDHLDQPLPPERITGLANPLPAVKKVHQPYSSIGGKALEQAGRFNTRVSQRLRHKNRALTSWDYERMVLEAFPEIYKVKCLPAGMADDPRLAGTIRLIVIPDIRGKLPFDPFAPKVPADTLENIKNFLLRHSSPSARFTINNPTYVYLTTRLNVRFRQGYNTSYATQALNQELQRYLAPWAYDRSADIVFGGGINANLIVNFVDERPYVDYVAGITLHIGSEEGASDHPRVDNEYRVDSDAILVSSRQHTIDVITEEGFEEEFFTGINYMKIELDFTVA